MLIDAHIHTSEISYCSRVPRDELIEVAKADSLDGIVLTNHYKNAYIDIPFADWRKKYADEYYLTKEIGAKNGIKVFFGVEITLDCSKRNDFLIMGITPEEVAAEENLCSLSIPELSDYCRAHNYLLYHAHPYRNTTPVDAQYLYGIEVNCHPLYKTNEKERIIAYADKFGLALSCGSDYHGDTYKAHCGVIVPDRISTTEEYVDYLRSHKRPELLIHDIIVK